MGWKEEMKESQPESDTLQHLTLLIVAIFVAYLAVDAVLEREAQKKSPAAGAEAAEVRDRILRLSTSYMESMRIAQKFESDTLPRLLRAGVVESFHSTDQKSILKVEKKQWRSLTADARSEILLEMMVTIRHRGSAPVAEVRDGQSNALLVDIHLPDKVVYYN
jgi:hypothetical protein